MDKEPLPADITRIVRLRMTTVKSWYRAELSKNPELQGDVELSFGIATTGSVTKVVIHRSTLNNESAETWLRNFIEGWSFPPSTKSTQTRLGLKLVQPF